MVSSLDGFIAKKNGHLDWLHSKDSYEKGITLTDDAIAVFLEKIDCYVMGSKTYEAALVNGWPYGEKPVYVLTHRALKNDRKSVKFIKGDLTKLVHKQLKPNYQNIWFVGGSVVTKEMLRLELVDEIIQSIMPIILGEGILFFDFIGKEQSLHLKDVTAYKDGMVELCYGVNHE